MQPRIFRGGNWWYGVSALIILVIVIYEYSEGNYISCIVQGVFLGSVLTSWIYSYLNRVDWND